MAKISELTELTTPSSGDFLVIVDSENNATKKIQASKVINVGYTDVISRFDYGRTNLDDIVASDFEFLELQPVTASSTVQYNSGSYDLIVGGGTSSTTQTVNAEFIGLRYNGSAILTGENLNITILGSVTTTANIGEFTATFRTLDLTASSGDVGAVNIRAVAEDAESSQNNGDRTVNVTGIQINFSEKPFTASGDFTGSIKLNQTKTLTLGTPFSYRVFTDGYDGD
jgi:hypothetical protein